MTKLYKGILGISAYFIFRFIYSKYELLIIETNIFGHAILESALLSRYIKENPKRKVFYVLHSYSANAFLTESVVNTLRELNINQNIFASHAIHGQDILMNRLGIDRKISTVQFQEDLTHLTASMLNFEDIPKFNFRSDLNYHDNEDRRSILLMNRSAAYKKFQESSNLHSYRDFDFSSIDSLEIQSNEAIEYQRIGVPDGFETKNRNILDCRQEIATDPQLDMKIQASATAYFGADSGPAWFALALSKPVAFINMIPLNQVSPVDSKKLVVIPKLIYSNKMERILTISEMLSPGVSKLRSTIEYAAADLVPVSNSSQDVSNLFNDWLLMLLNSKDIVDDSYMSEIRKKYNLLNLPSIHLKFVQNHPEVFSNE